MNTDSELNTNSIRTILIFIATAVTCVIIIWAFLPPFVFVGSLLGASLIKAYVNNNSNANDVELEERQGNIIIYIHDMY